MDMRARRALLSAALAAVFLLLAGRHPAPARAASVDPELVAESVTEDGYYVDSNASYLKSDADLDKLRAALEHSGKTGVVVLPAGTATGPVLTRLLQSPNRKATYVVLAGTRLQAASNNLPKATVDRLVAKADKASSPQAQVLTFLDLLGAKRQGGKSAPAGRKAGTIPGTMTPATDDTGAGTDVSSAPAAATSTKDSGGNGLLYAIGGVIVVVVVGLGGLLLWRRKAAASGGSASSA